MVTLTADLALLGLAATHGYVLATTASPPGYFAVYCVAMIVGCLAAAATTWIDVDDVVPALGWLAGTVSCGTFVIGYLVSRLVSLPGLPTVTGRWDLAPAASRWPARGFLALQLSVLSGVNVAFGQGRAWYD